MFDTKSAGRSALGIVLALALVGLVSVSRAAGGVDDPCSRLSDASLHARFPNLRLGPPTRNRGDCQWVVTDSAVHRTFVVDVAVWTHGDPLWASVLRSAQADPGFWIPVANLGDSAFYSWRNGITIFVRHQVVRVLVVDPAADRDGRRRREREIAPLVV